MTPDGETKIRDLTPFSLTIYDMCKAVDKGMVMNGVRVLEKHGGRTGSYHADEDT